MKKLHKALVSLAFLSAAVGQNLRAQSPQVDTTKRVQIQGVDVLRQKKAADLRRSPFAADGIDMQPLRSQNLDLNRVLDRLPGIRVRQSGGLGSEASYTIHGLTGNAIRFFVDGIPINNLGSAFGPGSIPSNSLERIEVYKGVTPIELGSDALGGAINLVTRQDVENNLELSYAAGSFNTHRATLSSNYRSKNQKVFAQLNAFGNSTDNNYEVWGPGVAIAGADGRIIENLRFKRFNDDYQSIGAKATIGLRELAWADLLSVGLYASGSDRGIQTGRTMAFVYGAVRYHDRFLMPNVRYVKRNLANGKLDIDVFAGINSLRGTTTDTSSNKFNWAGTIIDPNVQGELNGIRAQKSIYQFRDRNSQSRINANYRFSEQWQTRLAYNGSWARRDGSDQLGVAEWTIPLREPQHMNKNILAAAVEHNNRDKTFQQIISFRAFQYRAESVAYEYSGNSQRELVPITSDDLLWGGSYAARWIPAKDWALKMSLENSIRLPETVELFGDGTTILNSPNLRPEESQNLNASVQRSFGWSDEVRLETSGTYFFRNTQNLIWLGEGDLFGTARYENLEKIRSQGFEVEARLNIRERFFWTLSTTYQDIRNKQRLTPSGSSNVVFNDRLRNMPYFFANSEIRMQAIQAGKSKFLSAYLNTQYIEKFYFGWPSLGNRATNAFVPRQFIQDVGAAMTFENLGLTLGVDCYNLFNQQVYDNYLLQKPGRFLSLKITYHISNPF
ncbi:TonB-dependent receptor [Sphingobacterium chungjuense]|uniref:TonB-dependent receptor n=1 Tax=Sphingobacterium chungjuense TaxID=2675553 RepID=UPI00140DEF3E|nr:TonB-dependent receptor plug domain-containing protein [Sphingobacterium chungjuense]